MLRRLPWLLALLALLSIAGMYGQWAWWLDLCAHFRWQYGASAILLGVLAICLRHWSSALFALLILLFNAALIWPTAPAGQPHAPTLTNSGTVSLINANLWRDNPSNRLLIQWLQSAPADIVVLQELTAAHHAELGPVLHAQGLREVIVLPAADAFGIGVWTRLPVRSSQQRELGPFQLANIHAQLQVGDGVVDLFAVHPFPPVGAEGSAARDAHLRELSLWVNEEPRTALVLAGDFNATPWSYAVRELASTLQLDAGTHLDWPIPTWKPAAPLGLGWLLAVPIDHVMLRGGRLAEHQQGPDTGSDHRPQRVVIELAQLATSARAQR